MITYAQYTTYVFRNHLPPGTVVYMRGYARNSAGTAYSSDVSFTTLALTSANAILQPVEAGQIETYNDDGYPYWEGYEFTPLANGQVQRLCGDFSGSYEVYLYDYNFNELGYAYVTSNGSSWSCSNLSGSGNVTANFHYYVVLNGMNPGPGNELYYLGYYPGAPVFPITNGSTTVNGGVSDAGDNGGFGGDFYGPITGYLEGLVDAEIVYPTLPTITSPTVTSITPSQATLGATVTSNGGATLISRGTCWGSSPSPTTNCAADGSTATGTISMVRYSMANGTLEYYDGYAQNTLGTVYSPGGSFTTEFNIGSGGASSITTTSVSLAMTVYGARRGRQPRSAPASGPPRTRRTASPRAPPRLVPSTRAGPASPRAPSTTTAATSRTPPAPFIPAVPPSRPSEFRACSIRPLPAAYVAPESAGFQFYISSLGGDSSATYGTCWGTSPAPTTNCADQAVITYAQYTTYVFRNHLPPGTVVYMRGYARNSAGTAYSSDVSFTTLALTSANAILQPVEAGQIETYNDDGYPYWEGYEFTPLANGQVQRLCGDFSGSYEVYLYDYNFNELGYAYVTSNGSSWSCSNLSGSGNVTANFHYYVVLNGMNPGPGNEPYYLGYYPGAPVFPITNGSTTVNGGVSDAGDNGGFGGDFYGPITGYLEGLVDAEIVYPTLPTITSPTVTSITPSQATLGATVTSNGGATLISRGTCWGSSPSPTTNCAADGSTATGTISMVRYSMAPGVFYYYRGYVQNSAGTVYTSDGTFTTELPISNEGVNSVASSSVTLTMYSSGSGSIIAEGICVGTSQIR